MKLNSHHVFTIAGICATVAVSSPAYAQQADGVAEGDVVRYSRAVAEVGSEQGVTVWMHRPKGVNGWQLRLVDRKTDKTVALKTLSEWSGARYYSYDVTVREFDGVSVLIFEAAPTPGIEAPAGAESFQVAWAYSPERASGDAGWQQVANTRTSALDGGDRLVIRRDSGKERLLRLRTATETRFCGTNLAAYQVFDPAQLSFHSELDVPALVEGATPLETQLRENRASDSRFPSFSLWYSATSDRYNADDSRTVIRPLELGDAELDTAWVEGARGLGDGEFVTARINDALKLRGLFIAPGHLGDAKRYGQYARPSKLLISVEDGSRYTVELPDTPYRVLAERGGVRVDLPRPVKTSCLSVVLLSSRRGTVPVDPNDAWIASASAISELTPISELHGLAPDVAALVVVEKLLKEDDSRNARRLVQLTSPLAPELVNVLQSVLRGGSDEDRVRVIPLLRSLPSDASVPILVDIFESVETTDEAYTLVKPAIAAHGDRAAEALVALLRDNPPSQERKFTDLTRLIGRVGRPDHLGLLIQQLGEGSRHTRNERVRAISRGSTIMLPPLFAVAEKELDAPAGEDALLAISSIGGKVHFRGQGKHEGSDALLEVLGEASRRRTRLLALQGLGYFATEGAVVALTHVAEQANDPLLRREAVAAVSRYPERDARVVLEGALFDPSPDVRIAAIDGLGRRADQRQALSSIQRYVERETWTPGLEVGYTVLAELGDDKLISTMEAAIARDVKSARAAIAAEAMQRAGRSISPSLAAQLIRAPETDRRMRRNLIDLLGLGDSPDGEEILLAVVRGDMSFDDLTDRQAQRLRHRAILALGRRDSERGNAELVGMLRQAASSDLKAIVLRGLAFSRDRSVIAELAILKESAANELEDEFTQTIDIIDRRASIEELRQGIQDNLSSEESPGRAEDGQ